MMDGCWMGWWMGLGYGGLVLVRMGWWVGVG